MALKQENRWEAHPRTAAALKAVVYLMPVVLAAVAAHLAQRWLRVVYADMPVLLAMVLALPPAIVTLVVTERVMRRFLPLSMLLKLSLLFPDQVPSRLGIALRAASPKRLAKRVLSTDLVEAEIAETVLGLTAALNAHDRRTRGHSERVRALTMLMADELEIEGADRDKLEWASLLHDLGKLHVPPEILNKNGRPDDAEWQILRQHPAGGPAIAGALGEWLGEWVHAMDQHHEKFDGSGYPAGLTADQIAYSGRIVAVSDAFEVMTATRSYKSPMSTQAARSELVACAGSHFDPEVTRAFMEISIAQLHRALGPASWLVSLPFSGLVGHTSRIGASIMGGSTTPAIAAAAALVLATSGFDGSGSTTGAGAGAAEANAAIVSVHRSTPPEDSTPNGGRDDLDGSPRSTPATPSGPGEDAGDDAGEDAGDDADGDADAGDDIGRVLDPSGIDSSGIGTDIAAVVPAPPTIPLAPSGPGTPSVPSVPADPADGSGFVGDTVTGTTDVVTDLVTTVTDELGLGEAVGDVTAVVTDTTETLVDATEVLEDTTDALVDTAAGVTDVVGEVTGGATQSLTEPLTETLADASDTGGAVVDVAGQGAAQSVAEVVAVLAEPDQPDAGEPTETGLGETLGGSLGGLLG